MKINLPVMECKRCGYKWSPRPPAIPETHTGESVTVDVRQCAKCKSALYDIPKK